MAEAASVRDGDEGDTAACIRDACLVSSLLTRTACYSKQEEPRRGTKMKRLSVTCVRQKEGILSLGKKMVRRMTGRDDGGGETGNIRVK